MGKTGRDIGAEMVCFALKINGIVLLQSGGEYFALQYGLCVGGDAGAVVGSAANDPQYFSWSHTTSCRILHSVGIFSSFRKSFTSLLPRIPNGMKRSPLLMGRMTSGSFIFCISKNAYWGLRRMSAGEFAFALRELSRCAQCELCIAGSCVSVGWGREFLRISV